MGLPSAQHVAEAMGLEPLEDKDILEAQQARVLEQPERGFIDIKWDAGPLLARKVIDEQVAAERGHALAA